MLELGVFAEEEHRKIGRLAAERGLDWLVAVGEHAAQAAQAAREAGAEASEAASPEAALALLREALRPGDVVLVKASRRVGLEQVVEGLRHAD
jgi:UDP-N-acetylmuramoyl-tripeptide--D-alanyl-D-alanine ligase